MDIQQVCASCGENLTAPRSLAFEGRLLEVCPTCYNLGLIRGELCRRDLDPDTRLLIADSIEAIADWVKAASKKENAAETTASSSKRRRTD